MCNQVIWGPLKGALSIFIRECGGYQTRFSQALGSYPDDCVDHYQLPFVALWTIPQALPKVIEGKFHVISLLNVLLVDEWLL
ncbi:MAG: hypothetical protein G5701_06590 [Serratia symbiotica]|nr:hypothetical protein [Serratia symbiotica]